MHGAAPDFERLLIFGAGGHGREVAWLARQVWGASFGIEFVVDGPEYLADEISGIAVRLLADCIAMPGTRYLVALGDPNHRRKAADACEVLGLRAAVLVHPRVEASDSVTFCGGSVVCAGSILTVDIKVGEHVHINVGCTVSHDVIIGDFSTLSPGVNVSGNVRIGEGVFIGAGASIINGRTDAPLLIGEGAVVAAGACVTRSVEPGAMVAGVPAVSKR